MLSFPPCVRLVQSLEELATSVFAGEINAFCWPRALAGDFAEVVAALPTGPGIVSVPEEQLRSLALSPAGQQAVQCLLEDQRQLQEIGLTPVLDTVRGAPRPGGESLFPTDVASWHVDSATGEADTWLCTYLGACTEALRPEDALPRVQEPALRAALRQRFGEEEGAAFEEYLCNGFHDLHFVPRPGARPYSFGQGHLWRIALQHPEATVPPCVHRAPLTLPGHPPRLLLLS